MNGCLKENCVRMQDKVNSKWLKEVYLHKGTRVHKIIKQNDS